ncbi:sugar transport protein [Cyclospora cayetanensis]|uniref:Sugar transport protein n=1 Tax=Cyclospora cayetanensis TaxID=88456 RepID=A0A1D3D622_9EIME|nr:sugar transport protein [Cyclospora cayetanensis]
MNAPEATLHGFSVACVSGALVLVALSVGFLAISRLGIALNAACSMGAAAVTSFLWGIWVNNDKVSLLWVDGLAVALIVGGGAIAALFKEAGNTAAALQRLVTHDTLPPRRWSSLNITPSTAATEDAALADPSPSMEGPLLDDESVHSEAHVSTNLFSGANSKPPKRRGPPSSVASPLLRVSSDSAALNSPAGGAGSTWTSPALLAEGASALLAGEGAPADYPASASGALEGVEALSSLDRAAATLASLLSGVVGGMSLGPMSFVLPEAKGLAFLPSFGIGLFTANIVALCIFVLIRRLRGLRAPQFHCRRALLPGLLSGVLYSCSAVCVILAIPLRMAALSVVLLVFVIAWTPHSRVYALLR